MKVDEKNGKGGGRRVVPVNIVDEKYNKTSDEKNASVCARVREGLFLDSFF